MDSSSNNITRINQEKKRLTTKTKNIPKDSKSIAEKLIDRAAFMLITLEDMEFKIIADGQITEMSQGKYSIDRAHPLFSSYNAMVKNYSAVIKQLCDLLPNDDKDVLGNEILKFASKPKKTPK